MITHFTGLLSVCNDHNNKLYGFTLGLHTLFGMIIITHFTGLLSVWNDNTLYGFTVWNDHNNSVWNHHNNTLYGFTLCLE